MPRELFFDFNLYSQTLTVFEDRVNGGAVKGLIVNTSGIVFKTRHALPSLQGPIL